MSISEAYADDDEVGFEPVIDVARAITLRGVRLNHIHEHQCIELVLSSLRRAIGGWIVTHNLDHMRRLARDARFELLCEPADLRLADGMPLVWAARLQGTPLPERVTGSGLIISLSEAAARAGRSVFLLGGDPGTAELTGQELTKRFPELKIAGVACPEFGFEKDEQQLQLLREQLVDSGADIVYVALGSPKQERFIAEFRDVLPSAWWMGVGISLSFVSGKVRRAPRWLQCCGLEWTHRLVQEPRRLAKRYLVEDMPFAATLFTEAVRQRVANLARKVRPSDES